MIANRTARPAHRSGRWPRPEKRRAVGFAVCVGCLASGLALLALLGLLPLDALYGIRAVEFVLVDCPSLCEAELSAAMALPAGASFLNLDRDAVRARLGVIPRVASAELSYRWFHRLRVTVTERRALALVIASGEAPLEISREGILMAPRGSALADLPLFSWEAATEPLSCGDTLRANGASDLLDLLAATQAEWPALWEGISEAHLRAGGSCELYWSNSPIVVWTRGRLSPARLDAWARIIPDLERRGECDAVIDLRFPEQVVVRLPQKPPSATPEMS